MTNEQLIKCAEMQKDFKKLYSVTGMIDINDVYVHLTEYVFFEIFSENISEADRGESRYPYEYSAVFNDVKFICIMENPHGYIG